MVAANYSFRDLEFLGVSRILSKIHSEFFSIATLLTHLTKKGVQFTWRIQYQEAFELLKQKLTTTLVLMIPSSY